MKSQVRWMCLLAASLGQQAAFADDAFSAYRLGAYSEAAAPLLSKAGQDPIANYYLGRLYLYGYGQLKNNVLAMEYFLKAAEQGYLPAIQLMARYALLQDKNPEQAVNWFKQAALKGEVDAQLFMAAAYLYGFGVKKNTDTATRYFIEAAKNGSALAQFALAEDFLDSRHSANNKLGLIWLSKAALQGNPRAEVKLGTLYIEGKLVPKDKERGKELLQKAVTQNNSDAMVALGDLALAESKPEEALKWYKEAINLNNLNAQLHLARAYLQKGPLYNVNSGFLWTLKAAQNGLSEAKSDLAALYQKGIGVNVDADLAAQWAAQAKEKVSRPVTQELALWLSNQLTDQLEQTQYQLKGIFSAWQNPSVLKNNIYNQSPKMEAIPAAAIFKPQFSLTQPNEIPFTQYYEALISKETEVPANQWTYPSYHLNPQIEALDKVNSFVLNRVLLPAPYMEANYYQLDDFSSASLMDLWTKDWQKRLNYMSLFSHMYFKAILGDSQSQFEIGQMFQYGLGVDQNDEAAIVFYQNAAEQQNLAAMYNLGILYLKRDKNHEEYQLALNWLTDGAFKGNRKCQYVLSRLLSQGKKGPEGQVYLAANPEQSLSMLYLSAANNYGQAQYELGEYLTRQYHANLNVAVKKHQQQLIRQLYQGAASSGVAQALLPLAFYNAMDEDKQRQKEAFSIAKSQADSGNEKAALLLGMLYDRGIGVGADTANALYWYQHSGQNFISQFILGTYTAEGRGVKQNVAQGTELIKAAAETQFPYAEFNLAVLKQQQGQDFLPNLISAYHLGDSHAGIVLADYYLSEQNKGQEDTNKMQQAREIYTGLAEKGDEYAQLKLAYMLDKGIGTAADLNAAQRWYTAAAEQGNALAQYLLGQFYQLGLNGQANEEEAKKWYQKAASKMPKALVAIGFIDETVNDDYASALKVYEAAAAKADPLGQYNLALMYEYGKGVPVNYPKAQALFTEAASQGVHAAMNQLGGMYFYGLGQERNDQQALSWYKKAAALNNENALYALGLFSETGVAMKLDFTNALHYYQQAADLGNEKAMLALARMYHYGFGVEKDQKKALALYQKLAERENAYAQYQLATYYMEENKAEPLSQKAKQLLQQAANNGSLQARRILNHQEAQNADQVSFIEPVLMNRARVLSGLPADLMYFDALSEWNRGDEVLSRMILQRCVTQYPDFIPAKQIYEKLSRLNLRKQYS